MSKEERNGVSAENVKRISEEMARAVGAKSINGLAKPPRSLPPEVGKHMASQGILRVPLIRLWGQALKMCREQAGLTHREIAKSVGANEEAVQLWELDLGVIPPSEQMARLYGTIPRLKVYRFLVPRDAQRTSDMQAVAAARKKAEEKKKAAEAAQNPPKVEYVPTPMKHLEAAPPPPAPPPPAPPPPPEQAPTQPKMAATFALALREARLARRLDQVEAARLAGFGAPIWSTIERGFSVGPEPYRRICVLFPEMRYAPKPKFGRDFDRHRHAPEPKPLPIPAYNPPLPPEAAAPPPPAQAQVEPPPPVVAALPPVPPAPAPAPAAAETADLAALGVEYAKAVSRAVTASKKFEELWLVAEVAREERDAAQKEAEELLKRLQKAAGG